MPLNRASSRIPAQIGRIRVVFEQDSTGAAVTGELAIEVLDSEGKSLGAGAGGGQYYPNLIQHMTESQITAITNFINTIRTKAQAEVLP